MSLGSAAIDAKMRTIDYSGPRHQGGPIGFLIQGDAGTGKTTSLITAITYLLGTHGKDMPDTMPKVYHIDIDQMGGNLHEEAHEHKVPPECIKAFQFGGHPGTDPDAIRVMEQWMRTMAFKLPTPAMWAMDSLSALGEMCMCTVLNNAGRSGTTPQQQDYLRQMTGIKNLCRTLRALPATHGHVLIAHTDYEKDDVDGRMKQFLAVTGKLDRQLLREFTEIYNTRVTGSGAQTKYLWRTSATNNTIARTSLRLDEEIKQDFAIPLAAWRKHEQK